jgi:predicted TIM-barrel fold metal-dependent hydrolase
MLDVDELMRPYYDVLVEELGELDLYDAHTHIGDNDPDGFRQTPAQLLRVLDAARARAVVFPMHEPEGYREANDVAIAAAAESGGRLVAFCRVNPHNDAVAEATRALDAGAVGIKLHPRAEQFTLHEPAIRELIALAHERERPVLIHAGRGIPALGRDTVKLSEEFRGARLILAHCGISISRGCGRCCPTTPTCSSTRRGGRPPT